MTHLDLCTGIGGFHIAAQWAGFTTTGFSEIDPYCCALLAEKWPTIKNYGDIRNAESFRELAGRVCVLSAGVPCQPASLAGKRKGASDHRWLWPAVLDVVGLVKPAWCIFENPVGILSLDEFGGILLRLESLGYQVRAFSLPANAVGAKHRRNRLFIVANTERKRYNRWPDGWREAQSERSSFKSGRASSNAEALANANGSERWSPQSEGNERNGKETRWNQGANRYQRICDTDSLSTRFRLTQSPLCRRTDGIRNRSYRLKALGNAVVPQQAFPFFQAIVQVEAKNDRSAPEHQSLKELPPTAASFS
jgi:DNA (cytosine-5)-methyltransferase 1